MKICQMINVPESYRALPEKNVKKRSRRPEPTQEILDRLEELEKAGITAELKYVAKTKSYAITYKSSSPPAWENDISAADQWKEASLC